MEIREALAIHFPDGFSVGLGMPWRGRMIEPRKGDPEITKITVTEDLPGLHCYLERVRVWIGDTCILEAPTTSLDSIEYAVEEEPPTFV